MYLYVVNFYLLHLQEKKEEAKKELKKYTVKPPKDLRSKFELKMAARRQKEQEDEAEKLRQEAIAKELVLLLYLSYYSIRNKMLFSINSLLNLKKLISAIQFLLCCRKVRSRLPILCMVFAFTHGCWCWKAREKSLSHFSLNH